jgi:dihydrofolate reductase
MRNLKLQMSISLDGFVATAGNEPVNFIWNEEWRNFSIANLENVDCIILGRKTAPDFIPYWASIAEKPKDPDFLIAKKLTETPKVVFSKTLASSTWANATLATGDIVEEINELKKQVGNQMMVYGGAGFVSALIKNGLIDEYYLGVNPVVIGSGLRIFNELDGRRNLTLIKSQTFNGGLVLLHYVPKNN